MGTIFVVIFFYKIIYFSNSFPLITIWKIMMGTFLDFRDQSIIISGLFSNELVE